MELKNINLLLSKLDIQIVTKYVYDYFFMIALCCIDNQRIMESDWLRIF